MVPPNCLVPFTHSPRPLHLPAPLTYLPTLTPLPIQSPSHSPPSCPSFTTILHPSHPSHSSFWALSSLSLLPRSPQSPHSPIPTPFSSSCPVHLTICVISYLLSFPWLNHLPTWLPLIPSSSPFLILPGRAFLFAILSSLKQSSLYRIMKLPHKHN